MPKNNLSEEERALFRQTVGEVKIIEHNSVLLETKKKPKPAPKLIEENLSNQTSANVQPLRAEDSLSFLTTGLQKNILKKMRRGHFGLDADLDLHGLNSQQAQQYLLRFLRDCVEDGCHCVHIIHGKGHRSENNYPILKNNLNLWLRQHPDVQAFCSASPKNGGTGAVLVLLYLAEKYR